MTKPTIVVAPYPRTISETFDDDTLAELQATADVRWGQDDPMPEAAMREALLTADAVAFGEWRWPLDVLDAAGPRLRLLVDMLGTFDHAGLDYDRAFARGVRVGSIAPAFGPVVAEMCLALALDAARGVSASDRGFRDGTERYLHAGTVGSISLFGKTVGFVGCGSISRALQDLLAPFGVTILGYDPWLGGAALEERGIEAVELEPLFERAQVVFVLAVPTASNRGLVTDALMARLGPSDVLVLGSRAHVVDFDALTQHLRAGHFRAGVDVFPQEPLPGDHPIRGAAGAVLTAHIAGALPEALHQIGRMTVDDFKAVLADEPPVRLQYATPEMVASLRAP